MWEIAERFPRAVGTEGNRSWFSSLSTARHFHGAPGADCDGSGAPLGDADQELAFGALHGQRGFGVGLSLGEAASSASVTPGRRILSQWGTSRNSSKGVAQR